MRLSDLDIKGNIPTVLLLQTPSTQLSIFLEDKMKAKLHINSEAILTIENKSDYKKVREVLGITPPFSEKWFIKLNIDKLHDKDIINIIKESNTCFFFCTCSRYATYVDFKDKLKNVKVADFYINYLRKPDFVYLYDALTLSDNKLDNKMFNYVIQSYSGDVDAVLELFIRMNHGERFTSRKEIAEVCGVGGNSIESFLFTLFSPISGSEKGLRTTLKNRVVAGVDLGNTLGWDKFYNFFISSIERFCEIKMLLISGAVYKTIRNLPNTFDETKLSRYQKYMWRLKEIPMSKFIEVRECIGDKQWKSGADFINFIYKYYTIKCINLINSEQFECSQEN